MKGRGVDHDIGSVSSYRRLYLLVVGNFEVGVTKLDDIEIDQSRRQVTCQLAAGAKEKDPHIRRLLGIG